MGGAKQKKPPNSAKTRPTRNKAKKTNITPLDKLHGNGYQSNKSTKEAAEDWQQATLNIFRDTFNPLFQSPEFVSIQQQIKQALCSHVRDFAKAFGNESHLDVYAARWSPTRALAYTSILTKIWPHWLSALGSKRSANDDADVDNHPPLKMLSIGGGPAELVAFAGFLRFLEHENDGDDGVDGRAFGYLVLVDSAPWAPVVEKLCVRLASPAPLSPYASAAIKAANKPFLSASRLTPHVVQCDALALDESGLADIVGTSHPVLLTLLFSLSELFAASMPQTVRFLTLVTSHLPLCSLLLVIDSPGSYSETAIGKQAKLYPMHWLLDKILLDSDDTNAPDARKWTKFESHESIWFRLPKLVDYPIPLEDMRYQMHLYYLN